MQTLILLSLSSVATVGSPPPQPSWWKRQIVFGSHGDRSGWDINIDSPESWFNLIILVVVLFGVFYFAVLGASRVYRQRQQKASQSHNDK